MVFRNTKEVVNQLRLVCLDHKPAPESATNRHHLLKPQSKHRWCGWVGVGLNDDDDEGLCLIG